MPISRLTLIERVSRFLRSIETRGLEPSRWEGHCTKQALEALKIGNIAAAEGHIYRAKLVPELRTSDMLTGLSTEGRSPTLTELQTELEQIRGREAVAS